MSTAEEELLELLSAVRYASSLNEREVLTDAVAYAVERRWLGASAAARAARLLAQGHPLEAARLLVPAGWSVALAAVDLNQGPTHDTEYVRDFGHPNQTLPPASAGIVYVAQSRPESIPTDPMGIHFSVEDSCHNPDHGFETEALALCSEAIMLQVNLAEDGRMSIS